MRGIVFTGGKGPPAALCRGLAMDADLIAAADSGLVLAEDAGLRPALIIGDMDSLDDPRRLEKYPPKTIRRYPRDKDYTDTELALNFLWESSCDEVWIAGGGGGRTDHLLGISFLFERERSPDRWVTGTEDIFCLKAGGRISRSVPPQSLVSVFPLGDGPWEAESAALKWPLDGLEWKRGSFGLCNVAEKNEFSIRSLQGRFMVIIPFGENDGAYN